jgi:hypothetical protein
MEWKIVITVADVLWLLREITQELCLEEYSALSVTVPIYLFISIP